MFPVLTPKDVHENAKLSILFIQQWMSVIKCNKGDFWKIHKYNKYSGAVKGLQKLVCFEYHL